MDTHKTTVHSDVILLVTFAVILRLNLEFGQVVATGTGGTYFRFPVIHTSSSLAVATFHPSELTEDSAALNRTPLSSQVITLNEPFGQYFAVMQVGTPPAEIAVIIDTGSEMMWVQCEPCLKCGSQIRDPIFDPAKSQTYQKILCNSSWCNDTSGFAMYCSHTDHKTCLYNAQYGDNSTSYGELSQDTLTLHSVDGTPVTIPDFVFGCGLENTGVETDFNASGLMGVDRGDHSIVMQLGVQKFSYCLPDRTQNIDSTGFISFGEQQSQENMQYTVLIHNNKTDFYAQSYYLNLTGISVGQQPFVISSEIDQSTGNGGTIIDSGTALTHFIGETYSEFRDYVKTQISGNAAPIQYQGYDSCYAAPGTPQTPTIKLHFEGQIDLILPENNIWLQVTTGGERNVYCLAFGKAGQGGGGRNIIGNYQQQNVLVEYDMEGSRVGFAHVQCCTCSEAGSKRSDAGWKRRQEGKMEVLGWCLMSFLILLLG